MNNGRVLAAGAVALAVPVLLASPAAAEVTSDSDEISMTYIENGTLATIQCDFTVSSRWIEHTASSQTPFRLDGEAKTVAEDRPECTRAWLTIEGTYTDATTGETRTGIAEGNAGSLFVGAPPELRWSQHDGVAKGSLYVTHRIRFPDAVCAL